MACRPARWPGRSVAPNERLKSFLCGRICRHRRLTPQSRGRPQAGFARLRPPLTSNVSPLPQSPRQAVVEQSPSASVPSLNANSRVFQRWPQQASPTASTATSVQLVPSLTAQQGCPAGPIKSGLLHTPAAQCQVRRPPSCEAAQFTRLRGVGASRGPGESGAGSWFFSASFQVGCSSFSWPRALVASARLPASNSRQAKPAAIRWPALGRRAFSRPRANPSVKGTSCAYAHAAPYVER
jgi:hypothetical protein